MRGSRRISKKEWTALGGLRNTYCWRKQLAGGRWSYFVSWD